MRGILVQQWLMPVEIFGWRQKRQVQERWLRLYLPAQFPQVQEEMSSKKKKKFNVATDWY